jgi:putative tryptophan/tyrosine transport system substrate-binding protein
MSMNYARLELVAMLAFGLLAAPLSVEAQQAGKVYRIGLLPYSTCPAPPYANDPFRSALRNLGYVEGRNVVIECRAPPGQTERLPDLAAELVQLKIDVLLAESTPSALAAQRATATTPVVFVEVGDPVGSGLVRSLARPGENVTGMSALDPGQIMKGVGILKESASRLTRVAILLDLSNPIHAMHTSEHDAAANAMGLELRRFDVRSSSDLDAALTGIVRERAQAVYLRPLRIGRPEADRIVEFTVKNRLPTLGLVSPLYKAAGVLLFFTFSPAEQYDRAAIFVDRILKGANPANLPVEQPTKFELVINMKTAKALGLTIPPSLLLRADQVIE